ncbi:MAG: hypothetical protein Q9220_007390 [cf. Caloplaca sp. 1 TL-2023]
MELNKIYQFRVRTSKAIDAHTQLVVGHINKDNEDDDAELWDFQAYFFDLIFDDQRPLDFIYGGKCKNRSGTWICQEGSVYKFKGVLQMQQWSRVDIVVGEESDALIRGNDCYNIGTNNCRTFARKLSKKIANIPDQEPEPEVEPFDMEIRFDLDDSE